jgi:molecular chaperone HtpG
MSVVDQTKNETHPFEADVAKLLHMMVHSVYSDRDIFLRELISNAADACERLGMKRSPSPICSALTLRSRSRLPSMRKRKRSPLKTMASA